MTIGNLGSIGIPARSIYPSAVDEIRQIMPVAPEQRQTQNFVRSDYAETTIRPIENDGERPDFAAINLIKNSFPEPIPESRMQTFSLQDFIEGASSRRNATPQSFETPQTVTQEAELEERVAESATVQTSSEIAERDSGFELTPAQQRGVEEYVRVQDYTNPVRISMATAQFVA